jgi:superfamily I DNA/RNA helicase
MFGPEEIAAVTGTIRTLGTRERLEFLNRNAKAVAQSPLDRILIVSGPGTGKSTLFEDRIAYWGQQYVGTILVTTFVRKLVTELDNRLLGPSGGLSEERKGGVQPQTLHALARSILEKAMPWNEFRKHVHVVSNDKLDHLIWNDAAKDAADQNAWREFDTNRARATDPLPVSMGATVLVYRQLCRYYNAASFAEMILLAEQALRERPNLFTCDCAIVDELQDFNKAERNLLEIILGHAHSWLMAGDDDQVLYDDLKQSTRDLIVEKYNDRSVAKAMLPLCVRCDSHIVHAAAAFMEHCRLNDSQCIEKVFMAARDEPSLRIRLICCSNAKSTIQYLKTIYLASISDKMQHRLESLSSTNPETTDPYLLILTPEKKCKMLGSDGKQELLRSLAPYRTRTKAHCEGYFAIEECLAWAQAPTDNWLCRCTLARCRAIDEPLSQALAQESFAKHSPLYLCQNSAIATAQSVCESLISLLKDHGLSPQAKADCIAELLRIEDVDALAEEIDSGNLDVGVTPDSAYADELAAPDRDSPSILSAADLLTITGSKGLTADEVVIVGFDQMNMKHVKERAMYVALTRARHNLTLITTMGNGAASLPAYFDLLPESDLEFFKFTKTTKSSGRLTSFPTKWAYTHYVQLLASHR